MKPAREEGVVLSFRYKVLWGVAAAGINLVSGIYAALLPIFYQDYLGLAAGWMALASLIYAIWNAINDPLFGFITDNTRSRLGRRVPYMRYVAPFLALTFIAVWLAPRGAPQVWIFVWMLVSMLLYDSCYTMIGMVYSALLPEVTESDKQRSDLQISFSLFGMVGMLTGFLIPDFFRPKGGAEVSFAPLQVAMAVVAAVAAGLIIITSLVVRERPGLSTSEKALGLGAQVKATVTSGSFLVYVAVNFMVVLVTALVMGSVYYLADYVTKTSTIVLLACVFIPIIVGIPITAVFRARIGLVRAQQLFLVIAGTGLVGVALLPPALIPLGLVLAGFGLAGPQNLTNIFFAQIADEDELRSGIRREGSFFGINALLTKPAQSIAIALAPFILAASGFITREANGGGAVLDQPASAVWGIKLFAGLIPGLALYAGALILFAFPLHGARLDRMRTDLLALHAKKEGHAPTAP